VVTDFSTRKKLMRKREMIVCSSCGKTDCRVEELFEPEKLSMEEYARRHGKPFPANWYSSERTARRFLITCQDCGFQYEFMERIEGPQPITFDVEYKHEVTDHG
jgi:transcription elongation factor Elf1